MLVYIAADHAGYDLKEQVTHFLASRNVAFEDFGTFAPETGDSYVEFARRVTKAMHKKIGVGILICGTGAGMAMAANRSKKIRAAVCWNEEVARRVREEDDANVLCLPSRIIDAETATAIVSTFLSTTFSHEDRYRRRVNQLD